ncbi:MAG: FG-GAP-like repeat-containing protein, partial [Candidatus Eiseniibacteriota bacterium]
MRALSQRSDTSSPVRSRSGRPTDPRWAALLIACGALGALLLPSACRALDYVEATPSGAAFPEWDGGDTELCFADLNTDGHVDFVSIGDHGSPYINTDQHGVMVYFGDGQGGWSIHMEGNFGYGGIAVGDVNGDGLLDVGYGMHHNYSGNDLGNQLMEVALGDGTGTAWTPWDDGLATHGEDWGMMATDLADFDNDGDLDIVSGSFGCCNGVHVYRNEGNGSWTQTYALTGGNSDSQLAAGDVNGDGNADFVASYEHGTAFVGDGEGEFVVIDDGLPAAGGLGRPGVALGDIDGDGCADLSFTSGGGVRVYTWRTDHWEDASDGLPSSGDYALTALSDMDVDGHLDVVALGDGNGTVWLGDGAGHWTVGGSFGNGAASSSAALEVGGDVDHNGRPDVALVQREGSWPSDHNKLHVYREGTLATARRITVTVPHGNETLVAGSVRTLRWSAAQLGTVPAAITLELSTGGPGGPWEVIADDIPDSGHHQWTVAGAPGASAHIRATLTQGGESVVDVSAAFRIVPAATT